MLPARGTEEAGTEESKELREQGLWGAHAPKTHSQSQMFLPQNSESKNRRAVRQKRDQEIIGEDERDRQRKRDRETESEERHACLEVFRTISILYDAFCLKKK